MPRFEHLAQRAADATIRSFGEAIRLYPRLAGTGRLTVGHSVVDPNRSIMELEANVIMPTVIAPGDGITPGVRDFMSQKASGEISVAIRIADFEDPAQWPRQGDRIELRERPDETMMEVNVVLPDGMAWLVCSVTRLRDLPT